MILTDEDIEDARGPFPAYASEWSDDDFVKFSRVVERAVLRKLRERPADAYIQTSRTEQKLEWQKDEEMEGFYVYTPLHIIPEEHE